MCIDALALSWSLRGVGSAKLTWSPAGDEPVHIFTTYLGDALPELVEVGIALTLGARQSFATLLGEPVGHRIFFLGDEMIYIEIVRFEDLTSSEERWNRGTVRWTGRISRMSLIESIRNMTESFRDQHDVNEYERLWGFPFPVERYEMLRSSSR
jgi:hypothetical protein